MKYDNIEKDEVEEVEDNFILEQYKDILSDNSLLFFKKKLTQIQLENNDFYKLILNSLNSEEIENLENLFSSIN